MSKAEKAKPGSKRWREGWLEHFGGEIFETQDRIAACVAEALPDEKVRSHIEEAFTDYVLSATKMTADEYVRAVERADDGDELDEETEEALSDMNYFAAYPSHIFPEIIYLAASFTEQQNSRFVEAFRSAKWSLKDWEKQECMEESWPGVRDRLEHFQPDTAKAMIDHFISLGLDKHIAMEAWSGYLGQAKRAAAALKEARSVGVTAD